MRPLPLRQRALELGVLSLEARLAWAEALRPILKGLVTVEGSTGSGRLLKLSWDSWSNSLGGGRWRRRWSPLPGEGEASGWAGGARWSEGCWTVLVAGGALSNTQPADLSDCGGGEQRSLMSHNQERKRIDATTD